MFYSSGDLLNIENFVHKDRHTQEEFIKFRINELITRIKTLTRLKIVSFDVRKLCDIVDCLAKAETAVLNATGCLTFKLNAAIDEGLKNE